MAQIRSRALSPSVAETTVTGLVSARDTRAMGEQFAALGPQRIWLVIADEEVDYERSAINAMARELMRLHRLDRLSLMVAVIRSRTVRMGASLVRMMVRVPLHVVDTRAEALELIRSWRPEP